LSYKPLPGNVAIIHITSYKFQTCNIMNNAINNTDHTDLNGMMINEKSFGENDNELVMRCRTGGNTLASAWMDCQNTCLER